MFRKEIKWSCIGIPLGLCVCFLSIVSGVTILLMTFLFCFDYHTKTISSLLKHGPKAVLGMSYRSDPDYAVFITYLNKNFTEEQRNHYFMLHEK